MRCASVRVQAYAARRVACTVENGRPKQAPKQAPTPRRLPRGRTSHVVARAVEDELEAPLEQGWMARSSAGDGKIWRGGDGGVVRRIARLNSDPRRSGGRFEGGERPSVPREHPCAPVGIVSTTGDRRGDLGPHRWRSRLKLSPTPGGTSEVSDPCGGSATSHPPSSILDHPFTTGAVDRWVQAGRDLGRGPTWERGTRPRPRPNVDVGWDERSDEERWFQVRREMHTENRSVGSTEETLVRRVNGRMWRSGPGTTSKSTWIPTE